MKRYSLIVATTGARFDWHTEFKAHDDFGAVALVNKEILLWTDKGYFAEATLTEGEQKRPVSVFVVRKKANG